ncbi:dihydroxyacetone kinase-like protein [Haloactinospora alba]|uniref:Dihydroxyacetone kinase-like protein n=1 Tax=Haloactinospora alba TaxID=405555 RepID=A0A543NLC4_9ACTN|nr:dihydroxyacetone kinase subunit DhaL [Haloactinospora alba]TQN32597.1 dihydroxyacetone kinase-like protein [Haloactinospora alba]
MSDPGIDAGAARAWVRGAADVFGRRMDYLTGLDTAIGDGDHGTNMQRGFAAAAEAVGSGDHGTAGEVFTTTGRTLISSVGGASGPLYGSLFRTAGKRLSGAGTEPGDVGSALEDGVEAVGRLGGAREGDKTLLDACLPAVAALTGVLRSRGDVVEAARAAADAAAKGAKDTEDMVARKGRASYMGQRSAGHRDPGAASAALLFEALATAVGESKETG